MTDTNGLWNRRILEKIPLSNKLPNSMEVRYLTVSPDKANIVFAGRPKGEKHFRLYLSSADGSNMKEIKEAKGNDQGHTISPVWSMDGRKIAFSFLQGYDAELRVIYVK